MPLTINEKTDVSEARKITLAGREFFIPLLVLRQTVKIGPLMPAAMRFINRRGEAFKKVNGSRDENEALTEDQQLELVEAVNPTEAELDMALKIITAGLSRAYPTATIEDLYDLPISTADIIKAIPIVFAQTNGGDAEKEPEPGKAEAASQ